jgi:hypothetical protein
MPESEPNEVSKRKKREGAALNMNKNNYKLSVLREGGEVHDLTEEEVQELFRNKPELEGYLANPDSIPQELLEATLQESWEKAASKILALCWKYKGCHWFHEPVDPMKFSIDDYFNVVSKPMDFSTIRKKLNFNVYTSPHEFVEDVKTIFKNCYLYNGEHHEISACAKEI